ncbi:hypothetical protein OROHE_010575 [Orobanche hederae]
METISSYRERENMERKTTLLMSSDGHIFQVEEAVVAEFQAIHRFLPAGGAAIPISHITGQILAKVIEYCRKHNDHKLNRLLDQEISAWDRDFVVVNEKILVDLLTVRLWALKCQKRFYYYTAGSGGAGPTILSTSFSVVPAPAGVQPSSVALHKNTTNPYIPPIPYPGRLRPRKEETQFAEFYKMLSQQIIGRVLKHNTHQIKEHKAREIRQ